MPRRSRPARLLAAPAVLLLAAALGGCGGGDDEPAGTEDQTPAGAEDAEQVVRDWLTATVDGDVGACDLETESFSRTANKAAGANLSRSGDALSCPQRIKRSAAALADIGGDDYAKTIKGADVVAIDGDDSTITVEATYTDGADPTTFVLVSEGDGWLIDADSALTAGTSDPATDSATDATTDSATG